MLLTMQRARVHLAVVRGTEGEPGRHGQPRGPARAARGRHPRRVRPARAARPGLTGGGRGVGEPQPASNGRLHSRRFWARRRVPPCKSECWGQRALRERACRPSRIGRLRGRVGSRSEVAEEVRGRAARAVGRRGPRHRRRRQRRRRGGRRRRGRHAVGRGGAHRAAVAEALDGKVVISMANALARVGHEFQPLVPPRGSVAASVQAAVPEALRRRRASTTSRPRSSATSTTRSRATCWSARTTAEATRRSQRAHRQDPGHAPARRRRLSQRGADRGVHRRAAAAQRPVQDRAPPVKLHRHPTDVSVPADPRAPVRAPMRLYDTARGRSCRSSRARSSRMYTCGITPYDATHLGPRRRLRHLRRAAAAAARPRPRDALRAQHHRRRRRHPAQGPRARRPLPRPRRRRDRPLRRRHGGARRAAVLERAAGHVGHPRHPRLHRHGARPAATPTRPAARCTSTCRRFDALRPGQPLRPRARCSSCAAERGGNADDPNKRDPLDFVLWQPSAPDEPAWESLWGPGRPGWHIECSALALRELGTTIDLHGGGADLIFPHHECEAAQSEAATGEPFVRHWMHQAMVRMDGEKMSKSLGNLVFVSDLLQGVRPAGDPPRRSLAHHYRDVVGVGRRPIMPRGRGPPRRAGGAARRRATAALDEVRAALDDDLDTPRRRRGHRRGRRSGARACPPPPRSSASTWQRCLNRPVRAGLPEAARRQGLHGRRRQHRQLEVDQPNRTDCG